MNDIIAEVVAQLRTDLAAAGHDVPVTEYARKQGVKVPAVVVVGLATGQAAETLTGAAGYENQEFDVYSYAATSAAAFTLAEAVRVILQGYKGAMGSTTVTHCVSPNPFEKGTREPAKGSNSRSYYVLREYQIGHVN